MTEEIKTTKETTNTEPIQTGGKGKIKPRWKPGESGNLKGRPKGHRNFKTIFEEAAKEVAEVLKLGKKPDAVQIELVKRGIKEGLSGNYPFYKDLTERLFGKVQEKVDVTSGGNPIDREIKLNEKDKKLLHQALNYGKFGQKDRKQNKE